MICTALDHIRDVDINLMKINEVGKNIKLTHPKKTEANLKKLLQGDGEDEEDLGELATYEKVQETIEDLMKQAGYQKRARVGARRARTKGTKTKPAKRPACSASRRSLRRPSGACSSRSTSPSFRRKGVRVRV